MMISIVIPALNEERFLPACLESLQNQDYNGDWEIVLADNGSTDRTAEIARDFGARVISCSEQRGVFYARQKGADAARGDIIVQADADTVYPREWLKRIAARFEAHPETVAVAGKFLYRDPPWWAKAEYLLRYVGNILSSTFLGRPLIISGATFAFRRTAFLTVNGYTGLDYAADQYGIAGRLGKVGSIHYDNDLFVLTSSRRVKKPFVRIMYEALINMLRWEVYLLRSGLDSIYGLLAIKSVARRTAFTLSPITLLVVFMAYGYFVPSSLVFGKIYYKGESSERVVALTFDDGPNEPYTSEILDILERYNVKATFFVIGQNVEIYPGATLRMLDEGHVLGNHSYSHKANHAISDFGFEDLTRAEEVIFEVTKVRPSLYRPPYGQKTPWELNNLKKAGIIEVTWSVSVDEPLFGELSPEILTEQIVSEVDPGEIVLLFDGYETGDSDWESDMQLTIEALPLIIERLQAQGYRFVTVPELLNIPAYRTGPAPYDALSPD